MIRVQISDADMRRLTERITQRAAVRAYNEAVWAARQMEIEVVNILEASPLILDRPPERRKAYATHLVNSFQGRVVGTRGQLPVVAVLGIKPGVNEKKIAALEYGSPSHEISGPNGLAFPRRPRGDSPDQRVRGGLRSTRAAYGRRTSTGRADLFWTDTPVIHPGNRGYHFMRDARRRVKRMIRARG
jgi:hypothetical protein